MSWFDDGDAVMVLIAVLLGLFFVIGVPVMAVTAYRRTNLQRDELVALRYRLGVLEERMTMPTVTTSVSAAEIDPSSAMVAAATAEGLPPELATIPAKEASPPSFAANIGRDDSQPISGMPSYGDQASPQPSVAPRPAVGGERLSLEHLLGARGFVWIGGLSIALAGAFFVKYSLDQGLLSPALRIVIGALFGLVLLAAGEWMRSRSTSIAQALVAAGFADLFASLFAAHALYDLIPAPIDFALLAAVTFAGILAALRHGPFVGIVGMAGPVSDSIRRLFALAPPPLVVRGCSRPAGQPRLDLVLYRTQLDRGG